MNRKEQIEEAAKNVLNEPLLCSSQYPKEIQAAFRIGAEWADANPPNETIYHAAVAATVITAQKLAIAVEALRFYSDDKCMTMPEIQLPTDIDMINAPRTMINLAVMSIRSVAIDALAKIETIK